MSVPGAVSAENSGVVLYNAPEPMTQKLKTEAIVKGILYLLAAGGLIFGGVEAFRHLPKGTAHIQAQVLQGIGGGLACLVGSIFIYRALHLFEAAYKRNRTLPEFQFWTSPFRSSENNFNLLQKYGVHSRELLRGTDDVRGLPSTVKASESNRAFF